MFLLLSEGWAVVKCICECNQSGIGAVFYPEPVGGGVSFAALAHCNSFQQLFLTFKDGVKVIPWILPKIHLRNCGNSHRANYED